MMIELMVLQPAYTPDEESFVQVAGVTVFVNLDDAGELARLFLATTAYEFDAIVKDVLGQSIRNGPDASGPLVVIVIRFL